MTRFVYDTATSLDGFIATPDDSLAWLFAVGDTGDAQSDPFAGVGALVMGSATYEWIVREVQVEAHPDRWGAIHRGLPAFVFTTRELFVPESGGVRLVHGAVAVHAEAIRTAAGEADVRVLGGGDLAGQLLDAGLLDEIALSIAPVALGRGKPLLPRFVPASRLEVVETRRQGRLARVRLAVRAEGAARTDEARAAEEEATGETRHVTERIARPPAEVARFAGDPRNLPRWAEGLAAGVRERSGRWFADSPMGEVEVRFVAANDLGVLDHEVTLPDGGTTLNPFRVIGAPGGSAAVFTLHRAPDVDPAVFEADVARVHADLRALRRLLEAGTEYRAASTDERA